MRLTTQNHLKVRILCLLCVSIFLVGCLQSSASSHSPLTELLRRESPLKIASAHRGNPQSGEQNSIGSIKQAIDQGIALIEVDVRQSRDGGLFLYHDQRILPDRILESDDLIDQSFSALSSERVAMLRVLPQGYEVPRLEEALKLVVHSDSLLQLDLKKPTAAMIRRVIESAKSLSALQRTIIQCQNIEILKLVREEFPEVATLPRANDAQGFVSMLSLSPAIIQADESWLTPSLVKLARSMGVKILIRVSGTADDTPEGWERLSSKGVDIILTDFPNNCFFEKLDPGKREICGS